MSIPVVESFDKKKTVREFAKKKTIVHEKFGRKRTVRGKYSPEKSKEEEFKSPGSLIESVSRWGGRESRVSEEAVDTLLGVKRKMTKKDTVTKDNSQNNLLGLIA